MPSETQTLPYKRANFSTRLPVAYLYTASHSWIVKDANGLWRIGFTKFATRMLGEMVDHCFELPVGALVTPGEVVGWVEGFKALTEIYSIAEGEFAGGNPALIDDIAAISRDPYQLGWLYQVKGEPEAHCVDVEGYCAILDATIDRILEKQKNDETP